MMKYSNLIFFTLAVFAIALFVSCNNDDDDITINDLVIPDNLTINDDDFFSEDVVFANNTVYVSGFGDGTIKSIDLTQEIPTAIEFAEAEEGYWSSWGLASDGEVLLNILNNPNFADITNNGASKLVEYSLSTGLKTDEWDLPANGIGNSVQIINGKYYICEWNPVARITQIDPSTGAINENWFTSTDWDPSAGGLGGVIYNNNGGFYIAQGGKMWYLPIANDTPGTLQEVNVSGIDVIDADGITWVGDNTLYYAENDASDPTGNNGKVYKVEFSSSTVANGSVLVSDLNDSSGVWAFNGNGTNYLLILESQIGVFFGNDLEPPFNIDIIEL